MKIENLERLIEKHVVNIEKLGFSPVSSRILIYLFSKGIDGAEFDEIVNDLNVSKSAVSNSLKVMEMMKLISYKTINTSGKRKFFIFYNEFITGADMVEKHQSIIELLEDIVQFREVNDETSENIQKLILLHKMLLEELPKIFDKWKKMTTESKH